MLLLGSSVTKKIEQGTEMLGFLIYLGASGLFGIIYSLVFMLFKTQGLSSGLILSTIHLLFTMIILIALMGKHPLLKTKSERKNFYSFYNIVVVGVLHLVYGAIFGVMY
jgi:hypothetical protein